MTLKEITNEIRILGIIPPENTLGNHVHFQDYVYDIGGIENTMFKRPQRSYENSRF